MGDAFKPVIEREATNHGQPSAIRVRPPPRPHLLRQLGGPGAPREIRLEDEVLIGRAAGVDLMVDDPEVARTHAKVYRRGEAYALEDLGSRSGVRLGGLRISFALLRDGDRFEIGPAEFMYLEGG